MAANLFSQLSRRERQVLEIVYAEGAVTANDVIERMADPPSNSALRSTLRTLEAKGHVVHDQDGPRYVYRASVPHEKARQTALERLVQVFFDGSAASAAVALLRMADEVVPERDLTQLEKHIERAREEGR